MDARVVGSCLDSGHALSLRPGRRRMPLPACPKANCTGVNQGAPGVLSAVLTQCVIVGLSVCQSATRFGRLEVPVFATEFARTGANGSPVCADRIMLTCQLPNSVFSQVLPKWNRLFFPNGRS